MLFQDFTTFLGVQIYQLRYILHKSCKKINHTPGLTSRASLKGPSPQGSTSTLKRTPAYFKLIFYYSKNIIWVTRHEGSTFIVFDITFCDFTHVTLAATNITITSDSIITSLHSSVFYHSHNNPTHTLVNQSQLIVQIRHKKQYWVWKQLGSHTEIRHCWPMYLTDMAVAPLIYMLQTWFTSQKMPSESGNLLRYEPGL